MPRLSEKYIAGFLDADGCIRVMFRKDTTRPQMQVSFSQKSGWDEVLHRIQEVAGGTVSKSTVKGREYSRLIISGKNARMLLERIAKHLVLKRKQAFAALDVANRPTDDPDGVKTMLRDARESRLDTLPNFPTRKWLAGYFDGDGCLSVTRIKRLGGATMVAHVAAADYDADGLELLQKAFGGRIHDMRQGCKQWVLHLPASKAKVFLGHFAKHSIVKRDQIHFVLGCAKMGHYRDGKNIKAQLKALKAQEQRLSDSEVASLVSKVRDLPPQKRSDYEQFTRDDRGRITGKAA